MDVRVIYYDLSEWHGTTSNFNESPHKGILTISVQYPNSKYRHILSGKDYYYIKNKEIGMFNGDEKTVILTILNRPREERRKISQTSSLDLDFLRVGVWVDDRTMRRAYNRILERE